MFWTMLPVRIQMKCAGRPRVELDVQGTSLQIKTVEEDLLKELSAFFY